MQPGESQSAVELGGRGSPLGASRKSSLTESRASGSSGLSDSTEGELGPKAKEWNHFRKHPEMAGGEVWQHSRSGRKKGMAHPPQNAKVQRELLQYLEQNGIPARIPHRPIKPRVVEETSQRSSPVAKASAGKRMSALGGSPVKGELLVQAGRRASSTTQLKGSKGFEKFAASTWDSEAGWTLPWAPGVPLPKGESNGSRRGTKGVEGRVRPAELWAQQCNPQVKDGSKPLPSSFDDIDNQGRQLVDRSRHLAVDIDMKSVKDVSDLAMYHNSISRNLEKTTADSKCQLSQSMRSFQETMRSIGPKEAEDMSIDEFEEQLTRSFRIAKRKEQSTYNANLSKTILRA